MTHSNEQKPVDVLAMLDRVDACLLSLKEDLDMKALHIARLAEENSAVVELIEAARDDLRLRARVPVTSPQQLQDSGDRLRAALARVGGAP